MSANHPPGPGGRRCWRRTLSWGLGAAAALALAAGPPGGTEGPRPRPLPGAPPRDPGGGGGGRTTAPPPARVAYLVAELRRGGGHASAAVLAGYVEELGGHGPAGAWAGPALAELAADRSPLFRDRDKDEVTRLRALLLATLARVGVPRQAVPLLADQLANGDSAPTVAAAAAAAGALGPEAVGDATRRCVVP